MEGVNKVFLVGRLGKDPDLRYLNNNVAVSSFPLATNEPVLRNGIRSVQTEWHNIVMWRTLAEAAQKILKKNSLICIEGRLNTRSFEDKTGYMKVVTEVIADTFTMID